MVVAVARGLVRAATSEGVLAADKEGVAVRGGCLGRCETGVGWQGVVMLGREWGCNGMGVKDQGGQAKRVVEGTGKGTINCSQRQIPMFDFFYCKKLARLKNRRCDQLRSARAMPLRD